MIHAKRVWRFAVALEWVDSSCIEVLSRKDIDSRPSRRNVALRLDELAVLWLITPTMNICRSARRHWSHEMLASDRKVLQFQRSVA